MSNDTTTGDEMRHVPPLATVIERVGTIYRHRAEIALGVLGSGGIPAESAKALERHVQSASHWLERTTDLARRTRHPARHEQLDTSARLRSAIDSAADALQHLNPAEFRVRAPFHKFDHSPAEAIWESVLAAGYAIGLLCESLSANDRDLWWK
ncbi:MAG TPA: hypothetical protein VFV54_07445, partial [Thermoanaerobaculia bacterium]|nr:hypothetical protein [Thermoanaerobaculia bacterium]